MVSVVSSNPTGGNFLKCFKPLDVNFGLKCKCDLIVKNSSLNSSIEFCAIHLLRQEESQSQSGKNTWWVLNVEEFLGLKFAFH